MYPALSINHAATRIRMHPCPSHVMPEPGKAFTPTRIILQEQIINSDSGHVQSSQFLGEQYHGVRNSGPIQCADVPVELCPITIECIAIVTQRYPIFRIRRYFGSRD